jgi:hypothetical protein
VPRPTLPATQSPEARAALEHGLAGPEATFLAEPLDPQWAPKMQATIKASATWADVECRNLQCRVSFVAASGEEAMTKTDELRALVDLDGQPLAQWSPMPPIERANGTLELRVYAHFTRQ